MAADIPENEPLEARSGDTWKWTRSLADYPASTWTLTYRFKNARGGFEVTASASGNDYSVTVSSATSTAVPAGRYEWVAKVSGGGEVYTVDSGSLLVLENLSAGNAADRLDLRSHARKTLEAIEAVIENRATLDQEEMTLAGRSLKRTPITDLIMLRTRYQNEVRAEESADKLKNGIRTGRTIGVRF